MANHSASHRSKSLHIGARSIVTWGDGTRGIVVRLLPLDSTSRAYGRSAMVYVYGPEGRVYTRRVNVADLRAIGRAKRIPKVIVADVPPDARAVANHQLSRDVRRAVQDASYDPAAPYNAVFEKPLPATPTPFVLSRRRRQHHA